MDEIRKEVENQINYLGDSEYQLGCQRSEIKTVASIVAAIEQHRKQFEGGRVASLMSAIFASDENWKKVAAESEKAARDILLAESSLLQEADELTRRATEAKQLAERKNRELQSLWNDFQSIPGKADAINAKLASLKVERDSLGIDKLNAAFADHYRALLAETTQDRMALDLRSGVIATRELRFQIIVELEGELQAELRQLQEKNKRLAKTLNLKKHDF
jgi:hypothetical protein